MSDFSPVQAVGPNDLRFKVHTVHTTCPLGFQTWSGNSCWRWRYPSELYQNFTLDSLFTANCLAIALIWLDLWLGPWLYGFDFDKSRSLKSHKSHHLFWMVSLCFTLLIKIWTLNAFGCFGGELGHCRHSSLRSGRGCEGPGEKQGDAVVAMDNHSLIAKYAAPSDYVRQMEWGWMSYAYALHVKCSLQIKWFACTVVYVLCSSFGRPRKCAGKSAKGLHIFCVHVLFFDTVVLMFFLLETLAQRMHKRCIQVHMLCTDFCMFFIFQYFETFAERMPKQDALFWFFVCFSILSIVFGPAPIFHMQDCKIGGFLFACF